MAVNPKNHSRLCLLSGLLFLFVAVMNGMEPLMEDGKTYTP